MPLDLLNTLCDLVRLPSVNPMGRDVQGDVYYEHRVTDYLQQLFDRLGLPWVRQTVAPGRDNILARLDGEVPVMDGGPLLMFEVHQDTVPVEGMTIEPWQPEVRQGRVYGRGACDIKGGMACMLTALSRLAEQRPPGMATVVLACTVDEEYGFTGARHVGRLWQQDRDFLPRAPDAVVVSEPTELDVVVTHKGVVRWRCRTRGRAAHSSQPQLGHNAIYDMAHVVAALERYANQIVPALGEHPLLGRPSLSVGLIAGGISVNVVPDDCSIEIDRRMLPGEDERTAWQQAMEYVTRDLPPQIRLEYDEPHQAVPALAQDGNQQLAERVSRAARAAGGPGRSIGVPYGTDAPAFASAGIPTVVFGPGSIAQAHTVDEWIAVEQLEAATESYYRLPCEFG
ncbi:MAG: M20 family metallopeptidase [Pirellulaceae bacterium]|nr:M20 family metallopeptidase [Pirellulaceae bacterium]